MRSVERTLGQVKSGKKYRSDQTPVAGQQFEYIFDDIGNRKSTKAGGDENGANLRLANYTVTSLNQYTNREVPGYVDIMGVGLATNAVTVNGLSTYRKGEYFRKELSVDNNSAPVWQAVTNASPGQTSVTGNVLLAKTQEIFRHDADGNLTSDGLWTNRWNAENQLTSTESLTTVPSAARMKEEWSYLADGRWKERIVSAWNGSAYIGQYTNRYIWDGKVMLAVLDHTNGVVVSFMRGIDLSGTHQGAGGAGGVLAINIKTNGTHFMAFDGNGNVAALVSGTDGTVSANYEYDPFGQTIRITGTAAKANPIRFSTQYADDVTGDHKYLYRDYVTSPGRWKNRDPIGEEGGLNLYGFVYNGAVNAVDVRGLFKLDDHKFLTTKSFVYGIQSVSSPSTSACKKRMLDLLIDGNESQDHRHITDNRRHYNRDANKNETLADKEAADWAYALYVGSEFGNFYSDLEKPSKKTCKNAMLALGRITHSWQDFYAHAIRRDGRGSKENSQYPGWGAWQNGVTGNPENRENFWPSSYPGEHPLFDEPLIKFGNEFTFRFRSAFIYAGVQYKTYLDYWLTRCMCFCPD